MVLNSTFINILISTHPNKKSFNIRVVYSNKVTKIEIKK